MSYFGFVDNMILYPRRYWTRVTEYRLWLLAPLSGTLSPSSQVDDDCWSTKFINTCYMLLFMNMGRSHCSGTTMVASMADIQATVLWGGWNECQHRQQWAQLSTLDLFTNTKRCCLLHDHFSRYQHYYPNVHWLQHHSVSFHVQHNDGMKTTNNNNNNHLPINKAKRLLKRNKLNLSSYRVDDDVFMNG